MTDRLTAKTFEGETTIDQIAIKRRGKHRYCLLLMDDSLNLKTIVEEQWTHEMILFAIAHA